MVSPERMQLLEWTVTDFCKSLKDAQAKFDKWRELKNALGGDSAQTKVLDDLIAHEVRAIDEYRKALTFAEYRRDLAKAGEDV